MLCLLGPAAVAEGGALRPLTLRPTALALLAYLALHGGALRRDALARLLVPDAETPRAALRWQLAHLREAAAAAVAQALCARRDTVALEIGTDVEAFRDPEPEMVAAIAAFLDTNAGATLADTPA